MYAIQNNAAFEGTSSLQWRHNGRDSIKSPASRFFTQPFIQTQIKENIKAPRHWPLCGEFTGGRWIPRTNGQLRGKCFHLMTSSCGGSCAARTSSKSSVSMLSKLGMSRNSCIWFRQKTASRLIARFVGPTWGPHGAARTQMGPMLATWTLLSGLFLCRVDAKGQLGISPFVLSGVSPHNWSLTAVSQFRVAATWKEIGM